MTAYYNEIDPKAAAWLRELIKNGLIAHGEVDERSIEDVTPNDVRGFTQCHFFAGIGVWSHSLRKAGWSDDRPCWTGSCPCQPFSSAGKGKGFTDERHLWPAFFHLIQNVRPDVVFGEQVASKDGLAWLDLVQADLEGAGYACGATDTCAAGFGAPHIRQRLYWVANAESCGQPTRKLGEQTGSECTPSFGGAKLHEGCGRNDDGHGRENGIMDNASVERLPLWSGEAIYREETRCVDKRSGYACGMGISNNAGSQQGRQGSATNGHGYTADTAGCIERMADSEGIGSEQGSANTNCRGETVLEKQGSKPVNDSASNIEWASPTNGLWRDADWLFCRDGKWRPVEPGTFPLAHGAAARVGRLRGYGNAIVAAQAQGFIEAFMDFSA